MDWKCLFSTQIAVLSIWENFIFFAEVKQFSTRQNGASFFVEEHCEVTLLDQTPAFVFVTCHLGGKQNSNVCKAAVFFNLVFTVHSSKKHFSVKWSQLKWRHCPHLPWSPPCDCFGQSSNLTPNCWLLTKTKTKTFQFYISCKSNFKQLCV